jgi:hypothetical protein
MELAASSRAACLIGAAALTDALRKPWSAFLPSGRRTTGVHGAVFHARTFLVEGVRELAECATLFHQPIRLLDEATSVRVR